MKKINPKIIVVTTVGVLAILLISGYFVLNNRSKKDNALVSSSNSNNSQSVDAESKTTPTSVVASTEHQLLYLIEEEKLAHDIYTVMYQKYGANVFGNILQSESTHQSRVLTLLQARNIADPRSSEVGVFKNQDLQSLYNQLITQGNKSVAEAYKVGIIIEEKDIADITTQLTAATDQDVIDTLESLRKGSENHLSAFNKQL